MNPEIRTLSVGALTRVEGEGALHVTLTDGVVESVELNIYEPPRFFEAFLRGRAYTEPPDLTARVCGICPVAYQISASNAIEDACGVTVPPELVALRRLLYCGEWIHSHALHIFLLHTPDFLGYPDGISLARDRPDLIERGLAIKKTGNRLMEQIGGRAIHPINVRLGGFYSVPHKHDLKPLAEMLRRSLDDALDTLRSVAEFDFPDVEFDHELLSLADGERYPIENGTITRSDGPSFDVAEFSDHIVEAQVKHSTALHATLDGERYLTGPLGAVLAQLGRVVPDRSRGRRSGRTGPGMPESVPQHPRSRRRSGLRDRGVAAHHRRIRASGAAVRRRAGPRGRRTRRQRSSARAAVPPLRDRRRRPDSVGDDRAADRAEPGRHRARNGRAGRGESDIGRRDVDVAV